MIQSWASGMSPCALDLCQDGDCSEGTGRECAPAPADLLSTLQGLHFQFTMAFLPEILQCKHRATEEAVLKALTPLKLENAEDVIFNQSRAIG